MKLLFNLSDSMKDVQHACLFALSGAPVNDPKTALQECGMSRHDMRMTTIFDRQEPFLVDVLYPTYRQMGDSVLRRYGHLIRPSGHTREEIKKWILDSAVLWHLRPTTWAKRANVSHTTLNRFLDNDNEAKNLSATTISKLSSVIQDEVLRRAASDWLREDVAGIHQLGLAVANCVTLGRIGDPNGADEVPSDLNGSFSNGRSTIEMPVKSAYHMHTLGIFQVETDYYEPFFLRGELVIAAPICELKDEISDGDYVIHQRLMPEGKTVNQLRQLVIDPSQRSWLMPVGKRGLEEFPTATTHVGPITGRRHSAVTFLIVGTYKMLG